MTKATEAIIERLSCSEEQALMIQQLADTTLDGSKWDDASFAQVVRTAQYVWKAVA
jgi:hypothetical protein